MISDCGYLFWATLYNTWGDSDGIMSTTVNTAMLEVY